MNNGILDVCQVLENPERYKTIAKFAAKAFERRKVALAVEV